MAANGFNYTAGGKIQRSKLGNNRWESAKFNDRLQVTELALRTSDGDGSPWKLKYDYGELESKGVDFDANKNTCNIAKQTLTFNGLTNPLVQTFKYDSLYRPSEARETNGTGTSAPQTRKENFGYDRCGNRTGLERFVGTTQIVNNSKTHPPIDPAANLHNDSRLIRTILYLFIIRFLNLSEDSPTPGRLKCAPPSQGISALSDKILADLLIRSDLTNSRFDSFPSTD